MREAELVDAASPGLHDTRDAVSPVPYSTRDRDQVIRSHQTDRVREADVMDAASSSLQAKWDREVATFPECTRPCIHHQLLKSVQVCHRMCTVQRVI